jgi:hypothetical protein
MTYPLRSQELRRQVDSYLDESAKLANACLHSARATASFRRVYTASLSADVVLKNLDAKLLKPRLSAARSIVLRIPVLVSLGQPSLGSVELRRLVELTLWTVYFTDHPIEWGSLGRTPNEGFSRDARKPISYAARRELIHYFEYAHELMDSEPSGLGKRAINTMKQLTRELNASVHAGELAQSAAKSPPYEKVSEAVLQRFNRLQHSVFANCCLLVAAYRRREFDRLTATARAHFDWLVGSSLRREVRQGPFGLA